MSEQTSESDEATYCGAEFGEVREGECGCPRHAAYPDPLQDWPMPGYLKPDDMSTPPAGGVLVSTVAGCVDLCVSCSSAVKTFANLQVARDERYLLSTYRPPGGCICQSMEVDPSCPRCFPPAVLCRPCGEREEGRG